jgi:hypothetical protein
MRTLLRTLVLLGALTWAAPAWAISHWEDIVMTGVPLRPVAQASVTVYLQGTLTKATLTSDRAGLVSLANPVTTSQTGIYSFYVADGRYDLTVTAPGLTTYTRSDVGITDYVLPAGVIAGSVLASNGVGAAGVWSATPTLTSLTLGGDVILRRDVAGTLVQRDGVNTQSHLLYNTFTDASNYQRLSIYANYSAGPGIATESAGTGAASNRNLNLIAAASGSVAIWPGGTSQWVFQSGNILAPTTDLANDFGDATHRIGTGYFGTALRVGTNPATTGVLRIPNNTSIMSRNAANTGDYQLMQSAAGDRIFVGGGGNFQINLDPGTADIVWAKPLVALGGGAAPTVGTIGGTGPTTAAQNSWMRVLDSTGAAFWIPVWK